MFFYCRKKDKLYWKNAVSCMMGHEKRKKRENNTDKSALKEEMI
jgi:hypothetical protein